MKKLNKKGFTLVEIIVASVMALIIAGFLIAITIKMVNKNNDYYIDSLLLADKNVITKEIMDDINNPELRLKSIVVSNDGKNVEYSYEKINFSQEQETITKNFQIIDNADGTKTVKYDNFTRKLSKEGNVQSITASAKCSDGEMDIDGNCFNKDASVDIGLPIYTNYSNEDYGIKISIPYKTDEVEVIIPDSNKPLCENVVINTLRLELNTKDKPNFNRASYKDCNAFECESTVGIFTAEDDIGTSCYFRGDVENNYVKFAGFYWRIIRINGDGTIRMIYDGTIAHKNGEVSQNRRIQSGVFNTGKDDNAYVGYMYGTYRSTNYSATHKNTNNSNMKIILDNWYQKNILAKGYNEYVADSIYCNDRSLSTEGSYKGYGNNETYYGAYQRLNLTDEAGYSDPQPKLTCENKGDRFTVNNSQIITQDGKGTNEKLEYPIGLITADEVAFAGGFVPSYPNEKFYLYTGYAYWTMTPECMAGTEAGPLNTGPFMYAVYESGGLGNELVWDDYNWANTNNWFTSEYVIDNGIRPVLSIKSEYIKSGDGTAKNPFKVMK